MTIVYFLGALLASLVVLRAAVLLIFAETGRKHDLIKHVYKSGTDFQIAVLVPYLDIQKALALKELIQALNKQDYPMQRVGIHLVATEETVFGLPNQNDLPDTVKVWTYPAKSTQKGTALSWLIERLLAAGGPSKLFVFLEADDIVRSDFFRNVTTRAFDCFAMQGYLALKRPPKGVFATVMALSMRLINRIENAGRFHMGLSCRLMQSGWVIRQEILEMLPFKQGQDLDGLEYTLQLNLNGYRVNWAPNVVVYRDEKVEPISLFKQLAHSAVNRMRLTVQYGFSALLQGITRLDFNLFEQAWGIVKPPNFILGLLGLMVAYSLLQAPMFPNSTYFWSAFVMAYWTTQLFSLAVSRSSLKDVFSFLVLTPVVYAIGFIVFPFFFALALVEKVMGKREPKSQIRIGKRFDESMPAAKKAQSRLSTERVERLLPSFQSDFLDDESQQPAYSSQSLSQQPLPLEEDFAAIYSSKLDAPSGYFNAPQSSVEEPAASASTHTNQFRIPITNGQNVVHCQLEATEVLNPQTGQSEHFMVFSYKSLQFTTQRYRLLDQAYYELVTKLQAKGFTIVSCGSCAYFHRPPVGAIPSGFETYGFCLFGKLGQPIQFETEAITVLSQACQEFTEMSAREAVVQKWQASLEEYSQPAVL